MKLLLCDDSNSFGGAQVAFIRLYNLLDKDKRINLSCVFSKRNTKMSLEIGNSLNIYKGIGRSVLDLFFITKKKRDQAEKLFKLIKPDLLILNLPGIEFNLVYLLIAIKMRIPFIGWFHNVRSYIELNHRMNCIQWFQYKLRDLISEKIVYPKYKNMIIVSSSAKSECMQRFKSLPERIWVVENGYQFEKFEEQKELNDKIRIWKNTSKVIAIIAGVDMYVKGHDMFIQAASFLREKDIKYLVIGDGKDLNKVMEMVEDFDLTDRFCFTGWVKNPSTLFPLIDIISIPSRFEAHPLILLESIFNLCPIVASDIQPLKNELFEECLFPLGNIEIFSKKILEAIENGWNQRWKSKYDEITRKYSYKEWGGKIANILKNFL
jgi:glycosyltransferase involved in cell wall biosynthesis